MRANPARPLPVPPHSIEAEQAVLGSCMIDAKAWATIAGVLAPTDFYRAEHRVILQSRRAPSGPIKIGTDQFRLLHR